MIKQPEQSKTFTPSAGASVPTASIWPPSTVAARSAFARGNAAPGRQSTTGNLIHVQGHGEVSVAPDQATLNLGVETRSQDAQDALSKNSTQMNAVIAAIKAQGIPAKNIQT